MAIKGKSNAVPQRGGSFLSSHALHCPEANSLNLSQAFMRLVLVSLTKAVRSDLGIQVGFSHYSGQFLSPRVTRGKH
jgi:hypothetical protein